ncbi:ComEC/Rec2 family competence protein [Maritalea mediterranea]|uniref:ComEC/Rec2 family competence protein n=1 Tax=Maritalea mediterranea TaxID=2909667 RepID=A0ABS9E9G7_9HYPH|nr:ComEC/Rec2 family competence protein [Maritalea mediterranea]MCF4098549.1 ComEC/Rec2 family competence protein [Maritalea mediterranea]
MSASALVRGTPLLAYPTAGVISGEVLDMELRADGGLRTVLLLGEARPAALAGVRQVRLTVQQAHMSEESLPKIGAVMRVRARFIPVPKPTYPGGYDPQFHSFFQGIGAYGTSLDPIELPRDETSLWADIRTGIFELRMGIAERFHRAMSAPNAAIARALIIGDQSAIAPALRDKIAVSGLAHLLAISGLHLSLVAGGVFFGTRVALALPLFPAATPAKSIAAFAAMAAALFYLGLSGANIATQRATIMLMVALIAVLLGRRAITLRNVALVCLVMILLYPNEVFKPGFQLSFAAVAALVGVYEWIKAQRQIWQAPVWARFFAGLSLTSLVAGMATAPIAAVHFSQFAPFGLFANLIAVPLVGFLVLPALILSALLMPFGLEVPLLIVAGWGIDQVVTIAQFFTQLGGEWTYVSPLHFWVLPMCGLALMLFLLISRAWRFLPPLVAALVIGLFGEAPLPDLLISDQTRSAFLQTEKGQWAQLNRIGNNFTTRVWAEWLGADLAQQKTIGTCDRLGCVAQIGDQRLLFAREKIAILEDCGSVDLIVEQDYLYQDCTFGSPIVRKWDMRQFGAAAIYFKRDAHDTTRFEVRHAVRDANRPWRISYN